MRDFVPYSNVDIAKQINIAQSTMRGGKNWLSVLRPFICPYNELLPFIKNEDAVADIGCGSGAFLLTINHFSKAKQLRGIDPAIKEEAIVNAKKHNVFISRSESPKSLKAAQFDIVLLFDVLHHVTKRRRPEFLSECMELINPGGRFLIKEMAHRPRFFAILNVLHDLIFSRQLISHVESKNLEQFLTSKNFRITARGRQRRLWYHHYWICAERPALNSQL